MLNTSLYNYTWCQQYWFQNAIFGKDNGDWRYCIPKTSLDFKVTILAYLILAISVDESTRSLAVVRRVSIFGLNTSEPCNWMLTNSHRNDHLVVLYQKCFGKLSSIIVVQVITCGQNFPVKRITRFQYYYKRKYSSDCFSWTDWPIFSFSRVKLLCTTKHTYIANMHYGILTVTAIRVPTDSNDSNNESGSFLK